MASALAKAALRPRSDAGTGEHELTELRHKHWIVTHNDDRSRRDIRTIADRMTRLLKRHADMFAGKRPSRVG